MKTPNYTLRFIASTLLMLIALRSLFLFYTLMSVIEEAMPESNSFTSVGRNWICLPFLVFILGYLIQRILLLRKNRRPINWFSKRNEGIFVKSMKSNPFTISLILAIISIRVLYALFYIVTTPLVEVGSPTKLFWGLFFQV